MWVPFPFVEAPRIRNRPALVVSGPWRADGFRLYWTMMVTSVGNAGWPDDIAIGERFGEAGLPAPSVIRPAKVASVMENAARWLGHLPSPILKQVLAAISNKTILDDNEDPSY